MNRLVASSRGLVNYYDGIDISDEEKAIEQAMRARMNGVLDLIKSHATHEEVGHQHTSTPLSEIDVESDALLEEDGVQDSNVNESEVEIPSEEIQKEDRKSVLRDSSRRRTTDSRFQGMSDEERERREQEKTVKALKAIRQLEDQMSSNRGLKKGSGQTFIG